MRIRELLLTALSTALLVCCTNDKSQTVDAKITFTPESIEFNATQSTIELTLEANTDWSVEQCPEWITLSQTSGKKGTFEMLATAQANKTGDYRTEYIHFSADKVTFQLMAFQEIGDLISLSESNINAPSKGGEYKVTVSAVDEWSIADCPEWITPSKDKGTTGDEEITLTVAVSDSVSEREASVRFVCRDADCKLSVKQAQHDILEVAPTVISLADSLGTFAITVSTNVEYTCKVSQSWIRLDKRTPSAGGEILDFKYDANTTEASRTAEITFQAGSIKSDARITQYSAGQRANIYGYVTDLDNNPIGGVVVSDGKITAVTTADGLYRLQSEKQMGYVFVTLPSGYEATADPTAPAYPRFHSMLTKGSDQTERHDFNLVRLPSGNDAHTVIFTADTQFFNTRMSTSSMNDVELYKKYLLPDIEQHVAQRKTEHPVYGIVLGDFTCDTYWYTDNSFSRYNFAIPQYYELNKNYPCKLYHVQGNHDVEPRAQGDEAMQRPMVRMLCPTFYSLNIGKVHYMILDNIESQSYPNKSNLTLNGTSTTQVCQWEWIQNDLKHVPAGSKVVICMHAGYMSMDNMFVTKLGSMPGMSTIINTFAQDYDLEIMTGHSHWQCNYTYLSRGRTIREHRVASTCGMGWRNDFRWGNGVDFYMTGCGSSTGYLVMDFNGNEQSYYFKAYVQPVTRGMALYDMALVDDWVLNDLGYSASQVLANIWGYESGWTVKATENGVATAITRISDKDPYYYWWLKKNLPTLENHDPVYCKHLFSITPKQSKSTIVVTATDRFGRTYTDNITLSK